MSGRTGPSLFSPRDAGDEELEQTFVARTPLLEQLETALLEDTDGKTTRHHLLIGPRGAGKSHLTELLARRLGRNHGWTAVSLPEEHYTVGSLADLLELIVEHIAEEQLFADIADEEEVEERALDWLRARPGPIVVVVENLGMLLEKQMKKKRDHQRLRQLLSKDPPFALVATATSYLGDVEDEKEVFYQFFQVEDLEDLSRAQVKTLIRKRAEFDGAEELLGEFDAVESRIDAIFHMSGGSPRLALALYEVLREGVSDKLYKQLLGLLDQVTPYYQARLDKDVSPQGAKVLVRMALAPGSPTPSELAEACRMKVNQVTAIITKLCDARLVVKGGRVDGRTQRYEIKERLFRVWLQHREDRSKRRVLRFIVEFLALWYSGRPNDHHAALRAASRRFIHRSTTDGVRDHASWAFIEHLIAAVPAPLGTPLWVASFMQEVSEADSERMKQLVRSLEARFLVLPEYPVRMGLAVAKAFGGDIDEALHLLDDVLGSAPDNIAGCLYLQVKQRTGTATLEDIDRVEAAVVNPPALPMQLIPAAVILAELGLGDRANAALFKVVATFGKASKRVGRDVCMAHLMNGNVPHVHAAATSVPGWEKDRTLAVLGSFVDPEIDAADFESTVMSFWTPSDSPPWLCGIMAVWVLYTRRDTWRDWWGTIPAHDVSELLESALRADKGALLGVVEDVCRWARDDHAVELPPPFNEALTVLDAPDRDKALMALHPEIRDAVKLLLDIPLDE